MPASAVPCSLCSLWKCDSQGGSPNCLRGDSEEREGECWWGKRGRGGEGQEMEKQTHGEAERAAMQDGASSCWEAEGFGLLTSALALMAALTSPASLAAWWLLRASRSAELGGGRPPAPAHSRRLPRSLVFNQRLLFRHKSWCMGLPALLLIIDFLNWCLQRAWG